MARFLDKYVRTPLTALLQECPREGLPDMLLAMSAKELRISVGSDQFVVPREPAEPEGGPDVLPDDVEDTITGP